MKKFRTRDELAVVEGSKIIGELIRQIPSRIQAIWSLEKTEFPEMDKGFYANILNYINLDEMKSISSMESLPNALALIKIQQIQESIKAQSLILYLNDVQDPGNIGTIMRTAEWFGHKTIICSPRCADRFSNKVVQSSMGSVFRINVDVLEWDEMADVYPKHQFVYADMDGEDVNDWSNSESDFVVVIGNEGQGVDPRIKAKVDKPISIIGSNKSLTESLNASMAAGIIMHAWGPM